MIDFNVWLKQGCKGELVIPQNGKSEVVTVIDQFWDGEFIKANISERRGEFKRGENTFNFKIIQKGSNKQEMVITLKLNENTEV